VDPAQVELVHKEFTVIIEIYVASVLNAVVLRLLEEPLIYRMI
jgi:hypothetical protein